MSFINCSVWRAVRLAAVGVMAAGTSTASAFNIMLPDIHGPVTFAASRANGWNRAAADQLTGLVEDVDRGDVMFVFGPPPRIHPSPAYAPGHHFDRNPGVTDANAFQGGAAYVRTNLAAAIAAAAATPNIPGSRLAVAQGLHALEDFYSHSNYVDLNAADRTTLDNAIYDNTIALPAGLLMTGYNNAPAPGANAGLPPGDLRPHNTWALDTPGFNPNAAGAVVIGGVTATRHAHARGFAQTAAGGFLTRLAAGLTAGQAAGVQTAAAIEIGGDEARYQFAALTQYDPNGFIASASGNTAAFPMRTIIEDVRAGLLGAGPDIVGHDENLFTDTGEFLTVFREIRPTDFAFPVPVQVHAEFSTSAIVNLDPMTLKVFYADPDAESWAPVLGAVVSPTGFAEFSAGHGGVYAIGGTLVPEPSAGVLLVGLVLGGALVRRSKG